MRVLTVKLFPSKKQLEVFVRLDDGRSLRIPVDWYSKDASLPPPNWYDVVQAEVANFLSTDSSPMKKFMGGG